MKTPKKSKPVFLTPKARASRKHVTYSDNPEAFKTALAKMAVQFDAEQYFDRIRHNLSLVQRNAESVLRAKGIESPRFIELRTDGKTDWSKGKAAQLIRAYKERGSCVVFDWQIDEQARLAAKAHKEAAQALKSLDAGHLLNCIDRSLVAAVSGMEAIVAPYVEHRETQRKRTIDTKQRAQSVSNSWRRFRDEFGHSLQPGRVADFAWLNRELARIGAKPFPTYSAFKKWKSTHRPRFE